MPRIQLPAIRSKKTPWNKGRLIGQKRPLQPKQVWSIRARLELAGNLRDLALFNLAIESKLRDCDLVPLRVADLVVGDTVRERVSINQRKTRQPVKCDVSENTRKSILAWVASPEMRGCPMLFPSRFHDSPHLSTRQYARLVREWVSAIGLDPSSYGTHSLRRTKAALIYRKTGNLRAVQPLLGHTKVDSTVRYLGVELEDAPASQSVSTSDLGGERRGAVRLHEPVDRRMTVQPLKRARTRHIPIMLHARATPRAAARL
ncbi:MAG: tyrosine-type recombinase/integrase [Pacificimonas sp.]|jgi:integrase|nr:tyrosine-type recombinase/integrase [Pacificimonas sp.]